MTKVISKGSWMKLLIIGCCLLMTPAAWAQPQGESTLPRFELDLYWPQVPMHENWLTGGLGDVYGGNKTKCIY